MTSHRRTWSCRIVAFACIAATSRAQFLEDFETCPPGNVTSNGAPGCNGWQQWDGAPNATSLVTSDVAHSGGQSVSIDAIFGGQTSDLVHRFTGHTSGLSIIRAWQYLPGPGALPPLLPAHDKSYFLVLDTYQDLGPYHWSVQLSMDPVAGTWTVDAGSPATNTGPLIFDRWVAVGAEIDLSTDQCRVLYDDVPCAPAYSWTGGVFGQGGGALDIAAIDLYHGPATVPVSGKVYWDDVRLRQAQTPTPVSYCNAKVASIGCIPAIGFSGTPDAQAASGFFVTGTNFVNNKACVLFYSLAGSATTPFQSGLLCVKPPIRRTPATNTGGSAPPNNCTGAPSIDMNAFAHGALGGTPDPGLSVPGNVVYCQWWGRDPGFVAPNNTQLSNALAYTVGPFVSSGAHYRDMAFNSVRVRLGYGAPFSHTAILNGTITVSPNGAPNGSVLVAFDDGSSATIMQTPSGGTFIQSGGSLLDLLTPGTDAAPDGGLLNGMPVSLSALGDQLRSDMSFGLSPAFMSDSSRAMLAMGSLNFTSQWNLNTSVCAAVGWLGIDWCRAGAWAAAVAAGTTAVYICAVLCAAGGVVTLGALLCPCGAVCVGGVLLGTGALYAYLESLCPP